jgi:hypothetical protein
MMTVNQEMKYIKHFPSENVKANDHLGDLGVDERIILNWIWVLKCSGFEWLEILPSW